MDLDRTHVFCPPSFISHLFDFVFYWRRDPFFLDTVYLHVQDVHLGERAGPKPNHLASADTNGQIEKLHALATLHCAGPK